MCYMLNDKCQDLGCAQHAMGAEGEGSPWDHTGNWTDADINHLNWDFMKGRTRLRERVVSFGLVMLFEALVQYPNQDGQQQLHEWV